jgi:acyl dehydratase
MTKYVYEQVRRVADLRPGMAVEIPRRTILRSDFVSFCALTGDMNPIHLDDEAVEAVGGEVVAPAFLVVSMVIGQWAQTRWLDPVLTVFSGLDHLRMVAPVRAGDSLGGRVEVAAVRATSDGVRSLARLTFSATVTRRGSSAPVPVLGFDASFLLRDHELVVATTG